MTNSSAVEDILSDSDLDDADAQKVDQNLEEERVETPKPSYSDEELSHLVEYIQRMTILHALDQRDWHEEALDGIRQWLLEVNEPMLSIFYKGNTLTTLLGFPTTTTITDLTYFLRLPNEIYTVDGFHDEINFGTIHCDVDGCLLSCLQLIYAPIYRHYTEWPLNVRQRFCTSLDNCLTELSAVYHRMCGMTVMYVPHVMHELENERIAFDQLFVQNLETITIHWATQIRTLFGDRVLTVPNDFVTVEEEYEFWRYRYEVLQGLNAQLKQADIQQIMGVLRNANSVYSEQLDELVARSQRELDEAKSNIKYLQLLIKPCAQIEAAASPTDVPKLIPRIINIIRFIWINSDYYNTIELITGLFRNLSSQIINYCTKQTLVDVILAGSPRFGIKMCDMCIDCCTNYREIYDRMAKDHGERNPQLGWQLNNALIFNHITAFIERLQNVIDVCESMIVFGRLDEKENIPKPRFGGTGGHEFEQIADSVERQFLTTLKSLNAAQDLMLNVHRDDWYEKVAVYRRTVQCLEETVQRLIGNIFQHVCNVEEAIEALNVTLFYSYRNSLRKSYLRQVSNVWTMFNNEMDAISQWLMERKRLQKPHALRAVNYRVSFERLSWLRQRLVDSEWLPVVPEAAVALRKFEGMRQEFEWEGRLCFDDWQRGCSTNLSDKLDRYWIVRSRQKKGLIECNIDPMLLDIGEQAQHFERLGYKINDVVRKFYDGFDAMQWMYNNVLQLCLDYNHIISSLSHRERKLFRPLIQSLDRQLTPAFYKLTYHHNEDSQGDSFIADCAKQSHAFQQTVNMYKRANRKIIHICEQICDTSILNLSFTGAVTMSVYEQHMSTYTKKVTSELRTYYNTIIDILMAVSREFQPYIDQMAEEWHHLVNVFDDMLATALLTSARSSLTKVQNALHRDLDMAAAPILVMEANIIECQIVLTPAIDEIARLLTGSADRILNVLDQFSRIGYKMRLPKAQQRSAFSKAFREDAVCKEIIREIDAEIVNAREEINCYLVFWQGHQEVWETKEEDFTSRIKSTQMTAAVFEDSIEHYSELADQILFLDAIAYVHFLLINQNPIKSSMLDWIEKWQALNMQMLEDHAIAMIRNTYDYMKNNERIAMTVPRTMKETEAAKAYFERLINEVTPKQDTFISMLMLFVCLDKYQVSLDEETRNQLTGLENSWLHYLQKLHEADEMLDNNRDDFKVLLSQQSEKFKLNLKEFLDEYQVKLPAIGKARNVRD